MYSCIWLKIEDHATLNLIASWFVLIDDRLQNQTDSQHKYGLFTQSIDYKYIY